MSASAPMSDVAASRVGVDAVAALERGDPGGGVLLHARAPRRVQETISVCTGGVAQVTDGLQHRHAVAAGQRDHRHQREDLRAALDLARASALQVRDAVLVHDAEQSRLAVAGAGHALDAAHIAQPEQVEVHGLQRGVGLRGRGGHGGRSRLSCGHCFIWTCARRKRQIDFITVNIIPSTLEAKVSIVRLLKLRAQGGGGRSPRT